MAAPASAPASALRAGDADAAAAAVRGHVGRVEALVRGRGTGMQPETAAGTATGTGR
ncbi:hypothetical protein [Streptomyces sp. NPDC047718]|uniref:hypothetical protein n=1 Tax=Streptomyces sp. NPDC047718 TaxID=3155479 RepID=UPI0033F54A0E